MCVFTSIFAAVGTALGSIGASMAGAATAGSVAGAVGGGLISAGAAIGTSATALGTATSIGLGLGAVGLIGKSLADNKADSLSTSTGVAEQSPTSLSDTVSKSASTLKDTEKKSNPLSSLRIKQTNNNTVSGVNVGSDTGTGLNLGG
jgi:hypothetical protein